MEDESYLDDCFICGRETSSDSVGVPLCNNEQCTKDWFALPYIERVNLISQHHQLKEDAE